MAEPEREVNRQLASWLHSTCLASAPARTLDVGCGYPFLAHALAQFGGEAIGLDVDPKQIDECNQRLGHLPGVRFGMTSAPFPGAQPPAPFDVVTCMEVLEHCLEAERRRVIGELARLVAPSGLVVVSVPIEIGPSLAGKQLARALAAFRGLGDYHHRERYTAIEMARSLAGAAVPRVVVEGRGPDGPYRYHGHKGFDYRVVARELAAHFTIERRLFTPMPLLGPLLNSQAWFVCTPR
jgi:2-polyprenyl-3-methyl-5-hydroxy-6-metoxy-1,4-benzoquinol methylase